MFLIIAFGVKNVKYYLLYIVQSGKNVHILYRLQRGWSIDGGKTWSSSKDSPELGWKPATGSQSRADEDVYKRQGTMSQGLKGIQSLSESRSFSE